MALLGHNGFSEHSEAGVKDTAKIGLNLHSKSSIEFVNNIIQETLYAWRYVLIDSSIISVLKMDKAAKLMSWQMSGETSNQCGVPSVAISTIACLVQEKLNTEYLAIQADSIAIEDRVRALQEFGLLSNESNVKCHLNPAIDNLLKNCRVMPLIYAQKTICTTDLSLLESMGMIKWLHCVLLGSTNIGQAACLLDELSLQGGGIDDADFSPESKEYYCIKDSFSLNERYRELCRYLAVSLPYYLVLSLANFFDDVIISCSMDPLTERGLQDFLDEALMHCREEDVLFTSSDSDVIFDEAESNQQNQWQNGGLVDAIWDYSFRVDGERVRQISNHVPSVSHFPPTLGVSIVSEVSNNRKRVKIERQNTAMMLAPPREKEQDFCELSHGISHPLEERVKTFYEIYSPKKADEVAEICTKYKYHESKLVHHLHLKYHREYSKVCADKGRVVSVSFADFFIAIFRELESSCGKYFCSPFKYENYINGDSVLYLEEMLHQYFSIVLNVLGVWSVKLRTNGGSEEATQTRPDEIAQKLVLQLYQPSQMNDLSIRDYTKENMI